MSAMKGTSPALVEISFDRDKSAMNVTSLLYSAMTENMLAEEKYEAQQLEEWVGKIYPGFFYPSTGRVGIF